MENILEWEFQVTEQSKAQLPDFNRYLRALTKHPNEQTIAYPDENKFPPDIFSYFNYTLPNGGYHLVPIEPLAGLLRNPDYVLSNTGLTNKRYLVVDPHQAKREGKRHKYFYFDFGASTYRTGAGGASQEWFVSLFAQGNVSFDGIFGFEAQPYNANRIFSEIPTELLPNYHWYNVPVSHEPNNKMYAINFIKRVAQPEDFVLIKLDIDNTPVEEGIINALLADQQALDLVDEIFWEHHVNVPEMYPFWLTQTEVHTLKDSYNYFRRFREEGIRAHAWV